jgi:hypothetical protein
MPLLPKIMPLIEAELGPAKRGRNQVRSGGGGDGAPARCSIARHSSLARRWSASSCWHARQARSSSRTSRTLSVGRGPPSSPRARLAHTRTHATSGDAQGRSHARADRRAARAGHQRAGPAARHSGPPALAGVVHPRPGGPERGSRVRRGHGHARHVLAGGTSLLRVRCRRARIRQEKEKGRSRAYALPITAQRGECAPLLASSWMGPCAPVPFALTAG